MSGGGGGGDLLGAGLAIAAMVATDGAAASFLPEAMGMEAGLGATMVGGAALGAGSSALGNALTGGDIGRGALMGGLAGGAMAGIGSAMGPSGLPTTQVGGGEVAGAITTPTPTYDPMQASQEGFNYSGPSASAPPTTPMPGGGYDPMQASQEGFNYTGPGAASPGNLATTDANSFGEGWSSKGFNGGPGPGQTAGSNGIMDWMKNNKGLTALGGTAALMALINKDNKKYGVPTTTPYTGNGLQKFRYDPALYTPNTAPRYAAGGIADAMPPGGPVEQMSRDNALGQNQMFPQSQLQTNAFSSSINTPMGSNMIAAAGDTNIDPYTGAEKFAAGGGISGGLGSYAAGGNPHLLKGPGDGMSDNIPATISGKQPARLADGEFVVPADVVSHLGNGSTDAGAKQLYNMMDKVRKARTGVKRQGKQIKPGKYLPA